MLNRTHLKYVICIFLIRTYTAYICIQNSMKKNTYSIHRQIFTLSSENTNTQPGRSYQFAYDPPPFYPLSLDDLVADSSFALKSALISRINRIRIDVNLRITRNKKDKYMLEWLLLFAYEMIDTEFTKIHIFVNDDSHILLLNQVWEIKSNKVANASGTDVVLIKRCITVSPLTDIHLKKDDKLIIIYNPNNLVVSGELDDSASILEEVQALCFHSALRNIPVVLINPKLIATAWNDYGAREPSLLQDFAQAYAISDEYFMFSRERFCGTIQRASAGLDMFVLDGFAPGTMYPSNYTRIESFANGIPDSLDSSLTKELSKQPAIVQNIEKRMRRRSQPPST